MKGNEIIKSLFEDSILTKQRIINDDSILNNIVTVAEKVSNSIRNGGKLVLCGNGGSASDALHFAGEIVGRFIRERAPWPAVVLNADVATMTAISNDYGYDDVFARQAEAHVSTGDVFVGITTSGNSENVLKATIVAKRMGAYTVCLSGKGGGQLKEVADCSIVVPSDVTARIQESHITIIHILCELIEKSLAEKNE